MGRASKGRHAGETTTRTSSPPNRQGIENHAQILDLLARRLLAPDAVSRVVECGHGRDPELEQFSHLPLELSRATAAKQGGLSVQRLIVTASHLASASRRVHVLAYGNANLSPRRHFEKGTFRIWNLGGSPRLAEHTGNGSGSTTPY